MDLIMEELIHKLRLNITYSDDPDLFDIPLKLKSLMLLEEDNMPFEFKKTYYEYKSERLFMDGLPYHYTDDVDYRSIMYQLDNGMKGLRDGSNALYIAKLRYYGLALLPFFLTDASALGNGSPRIAREPEKNDLTGYIYPSYVIWRNDPSYYSFLGVPDKLEVPKDVLRKTYGHPEQRVLPRENIRHGYYNPRHFQSLP